MLNKILKHLNRFLRIIPNCGSGSVVYLSFSTVSWRSPTELGPHQPRLFSSLGSQLLYMCSRYHIARANLFKYFCLSLLCKIGTTVSHTGEWIDIGKIQYQHVKFSQYSYRSDTNSCYSESFICSSEILIITARNNPIHVKIQFLVVCTVLLLWERRLFPAGGYGSLQKRSVGLEHTIGPRDINNSF